MTIIAGFQCTDGILFCSDTEETMSRTAKSQVRKVHIRQGGYTLAMGGAGDGALSDFIIQDLPKYLGARQWDWNDVESILNDYAQLIFRRHIRPYSGFDPDLIPDLAFLIGLVKDSRAALFKWERNFAFLVPYPRHASIGIGTLQSEYLLSGIQYSLPAWGMLFLAIRMMQQVKRLVAGCGGKTEAAIIYSGSSTVVRQGVFVSDQIEHIADTVEEFLTDYALLFVSDNSKLSDQEIAQKISVLSKGLTNLRQKYIDLLPGVFINSTQ